MNKRGISGVVAAILLVLIVIVTASIIFTWQRSFQSSSKKQGQAFTCLNVDLSIMDACYEDDDLYISLKNNEQATIGDYIIVILYYESHSQKIPSPPIITIPPFQTAKITVPYEGEIEKIEIIPKIENNGFCPENAPQADLHQC